MTPLPPYISIIILAAGASRRMGTPKQLLPWKKSTLLGHSISAALRSSAAEVIVVLGAHKTSIEKEIMPQPVSILENTAWETGLGSSIACGIRHILKTDKKRDGVLVMLADQPQIDHEYLDRLIENFTIHKNKIIATSYKEKAGVPAIFGRAYFNALAHLQEDYGAKHLMKTYAKDVVVIHPGHPVMDIDTMEEYRSLSRKLS